MLGGIGTLLNRDELIMKEIMKKKYIVYGSQAIENQIGFLFSRTPKDWDVLSSSPKKSARELERKLDRVSGGDFFFSRPSFFKKTTHKVIYKGADMKPNTSDDIGIVDFSKYEGQETVNVRGIKMVKLKEIIKDKRRSLSNKKFMFRHDKDRSDINRIKEFRRLRL